MKRATDDAITLGDVACFTQAALEAASAARAPDNVLDHLLDAMRALHNESEGSATGKLSAEC